ncbi:uncharacterized protein BO66DRAFT_194658 [Aspergillus aculeatinus CBS 121060]|uniref:Uncharacterized protein n=1 Tax=Aspergillus aculeatinus CBS 121060 TaxID=1448322 RepID=A0ACD1GX17_9EURO|nr:hypothetical protein BO66DRAFT_194658 [Aspergillus aculeatinus CBS 121060]RAH65823.1 hypothetical protein BO66DRAFT_194658 [Aspergillus aculeatinus CBS 121060]
MSPMNDIGSGPSSRPYTVPADQKQETISRLRTETPRPCPPDGLSPLRMIRKLSCGGVSIPGCPRLSQVGSFTVSVSPACLPVCLLPFCLEESTQPVPWNLNLAGGKGKDKDTVLSKLVSLSSSLLGNDWLGGNDKVLHATQAGLGLRYRRKQSSPSVKRLHRADNKKLGQWKPLCLWVKTSSAKDRLP